jgi:hypothetical protein
LSKDDLQDPSSWSSSPLLLLCDIHSILLAGYHCKEGCAPSQSQVHVGGNDGLNSQDGASQEQKDVSLTIPQLNRLTEASLVRGEDAKCTRCKTSLLPPLRFSYDRLSIVFTRLLCEIRSHLNRGSLDRLYHRFNAFCLGR